MLYYDGYDLSYVIKPGMWAYKTNADSTVYIKSEINQNIGDQAIEAMAISTVILTLVIGNDVY